EARLNQLDAALADCEASLRLKPGPDDREPLALLCNNLAWTLVSGPTSSRSPARALDLARHAVELTPNRAIYHNTLGVALYRAGHYAEAVPVLERSLAAGKGETDAFDLFFLAMARHRLGATAAARADFDRAVRWIGDHPNLDARWLTELSTFHTEAASLFLEAGFPADPFAGEVR